MHRCARSRPESREQRAESSLSYTTLSRKEPRSPPEQSSNCNTTTPSVALLRQSLFRPHSRDHSCQYHSRPAPSFAQIVAGNEPAFSPVTHSSWESTGLVTALLASISNWKFVQLAARKSCGNGCANSYADQESERTKKESSLWSKIFLLLSGWLSC